MKTIKEIFVPDMGTDKPVDVIEILVSPGQTVNVDDSLVTLESEKASMEVPSPYVGVVKEIKVAIGDKIKNGSLILTLEAGDSGSTEQSETAPTEKVPQQKTETKNEPKVEAPTEPSSAVTKQEKAEAPQKPEQANEIEQDVDGTLVHAGPAVRRLAREFGVDLNQVQGTGNKGRIQTSDVQSFVKKALARGNQGSGLSVSEMPAIDFSKFGAIERQSLSKIKRVTAQNVHRSWVTVPHVTQFAEADITELEDFRQANRQRAEKQGFKLTPIVFILKAIVACLKQFPTFNASLDVGGEQLILKQYFHIGVAVDTPQGLVVPVLRDVDQKGVYELAGELAKISAKAREKGLMPADMQGGCFTISSLGGIGGTGFTPIVNAPEVAILGVSKAEMKPVYQAGQFVPRLMLPLALSYDHRVIDGAEAARFIVCLSDLLSDIRRLLL